MVRYRCRICKHEESSFPAIVDHISMNHWNEFKKEHPEEMDRHSRLFEQWTYYQIEKVD